MVNVSRIVRMENLQTFLNQLLGLFVQKTPGKDLSTNDYTTEEKEKLAAISEGANNYVLPKASTKSLGGIIVGENLSITSEGVLSADAQKTDLSPYATKEYLDTNYAKKSDLSSVYTYKGSMDNYSDLPVNGKAIGDVYNIVNTDDKHGIKAGDNVAWNGNSWDNLSGIDDLSAYAKEAELQNYMKISDYPFATEEDVNSLFQGD